MMMKPIPGYTMTRKRMIGALMYQKSSRLFIRAHFGQPY